MLQHLMTIIEEMQSGRISIIVDLRVIELNVTMQIHNFGNVGQGLNVICSL